MQFIDIGANLTDSVFNGVYRGKRAHDDDFATILRRAADVGVKSVFITSGMLDEAEAAAKLCKNPAYRAPKLFTTCGVHPTRCGLFETDGADPEVYLQCLREFIEKNSLRNSVDGTGCVVAVGEFGLDFDRLHFCSKEVQLKYFEKQFQLAEESNLPLFLHSRNAGSEFIEILKRNRDRFSKCVVHSFTGTLGEAQGLLEEFSDRLFIGINGCSLKTAENLEVVKRIPIDRVLFETDAPFCGIRPSHASARFIKTSFPEVRKEKWCSEKYVKGRSEPSHIINVLEVAAALHDMDQQTVASTVFESTQRLFSLPL